MTTSADLLSLPEAAERLGIHYMTAYRHVRTGRLPARLDGTRWLVDPDDVAAATRGRRGRPRTERGGDTRAAPRRPPVHRLADRLVAGDRNGAWQILAEHLAGGATAEQAVVGLLAAAMREVGDRWAAGTATVADEHQATTTATALLGRMDGIGARPGRRRGDVLVGCAPHDPHALAPGLLAEVLRGRGYRVVDLGGDVPEVEFAAVAASQPFRAVCISVSVDARRRGARALVRAVRTAAPHAEVLVGGAAVSSPDDAATLGADGWAANASDLADRLETPGKGQV